MMYWLIFLLLFSGCLNAQNLLNGPEGIFFHSPSSTYYVANAMDGKIITIDTQGVHDEFAIGLTTPMEVLIVNDVLYVSANDPKMLYGFNINDGEMIFDLPMDEAMAPSGMCFDERTNLIYITDQGGRIFTYNVLTEVLEIYIDTGQGVSASVQDVVLDVANNRLVVCFYAYNLALKEIDLTNGSVSTISGTGGGNHVGINMDQAGHFYVSNWSTNEVLYYNNDFSEGGVFSTGQNQPVGITFNYDIDFLIVANFGGNSIDLIYMYLTDSDDQVVPDSGELDIKIAPNPFNPSTSITIKLSGNSNKDSMELAIYNMKGQKVKDLPILDSKNHYLTTVWNGEDNDGRPVSSGAYYCLIGEGDQTVRKKMTLLK